MTSAMTAPCVEIIWRPSPNHDARAAGMPVDILVLHYTGMPSAEAALQHLTDVAARVSAHYTIDEDGRIFAHVPEDRRAWHAGVASWGGATDVNGRSIGIELVNPGHEFGYRDFPTAQIEALIGLARDIVGRYAIAPARVLGHSDVAPARKEDPGERFPWARLAAAGIGLWPGPVQRTHRACLRRGARGPAVERLQARLARFGYGLAVTGDFDNGTAKVVAAFQRHFHPLRVTGAADGVTQARLAAVLRQSGL